MLRNNIKLTESQFHSIIKESVKRILKEYTWNGRTPEQDAASINAANTPMSWKSHMLRAQDKRNQGKGWDSNLIDKANGAFHQKHGTKYDYYEDDYDTGGGHANMVRGSLTRVSPTGGRMAFNQKSKDDNAERYHEKVYGDFNSQNLDSVTDKDFENGYVPTYGGSRNVWGDKRSGSESLNRSHEESPRTRNKRYLPMSQSFSGKVKDIDNDMNDFYSGDYRERMNQKRQQLGR